MVRTLFTLIDTGGLELKSNDAMFSHIETQARAAIDVADVILFSPTRKQVSFRPITT